MEVEVLQGFLNYGALGLLCIVLLYVLHRVSEPLFAYKELFEQINKTLEGLQKSQEITNKFLMETIAHERAQSVSCRDIIMDSISEHEAKSYQRQTEIEKVLTAIHNDLKNLHLSCQLPKKG